MTGRIDDELRSAGPRQTSSNTLPKSHSATTATSRQSTASSNMRSELQLKTGSLICSKSDRRPLPQTLSRKKSAILAQLCTIHSRIIGQYMNIVDSTLRKHSHHCDHLPHDTHHLIVCPSKPTTLTVFTQWTAPTEAAKHLNLAIVETS